MNTNNEENDFEKELKQINKQPLPNTINDQIYLGIARARHQRKRWEIVKHTGLSVVALFLMFVLSVNFIPGFSNVAGNIPGFDKLVKLVDYDQGLEDAVKNQYVQEIDKSDTEAGITLTIDNLIIDKRRALLFFSLDTDKNYEIMGIESAQLYDKNGEAIDNYSVSYPRIDLYKNDNSEMLDFQWNVDQNFSDEMTLKVKLREYLKMDQTEGREIAATFEVSFPIDLKKIQLSKTYDINETTTLDGQAIHIDRLESFPTREVLYLKYDEENTKQFLQLSDLRLENEKGETVATEYMSTGGENERIISMTGNYFKEYEHLYLVLNKAMALDKDKKKVIVDVEKKQLIKAPDDRLTLQDVTPESIHFKIDISDQHSNEQLDFGLNSTFTDGTGTKYYSNSQAHSPSSGEYWYYFEEVGENYSNPLTMTLYHYPSYIEDDIRIQIK